MGERVLLVALLIAPVAMIAFAIRARRAREAGHATSADGRARPWDKSLRNGMLLAVGGALLALSGVFAYSRAAGTRAAPLFALPVILGIVLAVSGYRAWMRGVAQVPEGEESERPAGG